MAKAPQKAPEKVRYRVVAPVYVNDTLIKPDDPVHQGRPVYINAVPGLEGKALELAPEAKAGDPNTQSGA